MEDVSETPLIETHPKRFYVIRIITLIIVSLMYSLVTFHKFCPSIVAEEMASAYGVTKSELGVFSSIYFYPYAIMQPFAGLFADIFDPAISLAVFSILASAGTALCGISKTITVGMIGRFFVGLGTSPVYVSCLKIFSNWYRKESLPVLLGILMSFSCFGGFLAGTPLSLFCRILGWRLAFYVIGGSSAFISLIVLIFIRGSPEKKGFSPVNDNFILDQGSSTFLDKMKLLYKNTIQIIPYKHFWVIAAYNLTAICPYFNIGGYWGGPFLNDVLGYTITETGSAMISISIGLLVGSLVLPHLGNLLKSKKFVLMMSSFLATVPMVVLYLYGNKLSKFVIKILYAIIGCFTASLTTLDYPLLSSYYSPLISGSAVGIANFILNIMVAAYQQGSGYVIPLFGVVPSESGVKNYTWNGYKNGLWLFMGISTFVSFLISIFIRDPESRLCVIRPKRQFNNDDTLTSSIVSMDN